MQFRSTRGEERTTFADAVIRGLAEDGGLFVPVEIPKISTDVQQKWRALDYSSLCLEVMSHFIPSDDVPREVLLDIIQRAYKSFRLSDVTPIASLGEFHLLELFHGPTFAFKDVALQFLGNLFEYLNGQRSRSMVVVGATSGDTGSAAIDGLRGRKNTECVILFPKGRTSITQKLQMVTVPDPNIHCLELDGTFDDCQSIVKALLASPLKQQLNLGAVNSINFARILAQMVYYWYSSLRIQNGNQDVKVDVSVPTGNFGNILAAYYAKLMGAPLGRLIIASNENDILTRFHESGSYKLGDVCPTISPSMDIQVSSNFERFLFDAFHQDSEAVKSLFDGLKNSSSFSVGSEELERCTSVFAAYRASEEETRVAIKEVKEKYGEILDPHTAVGYVCARKYRESRPRDSPIMIVSTAHFGKFPETVESIVGKEAVQAEMPQELLKLHELPQRCENLPACYEAVRDYLTSKFKPSPPI